jgi:uncharacterized repeat protein (TIGR04044 family)
MAVETKLTDQEIASMMEIAHPTKRRVSRSMDPPRCSPTIRPSPERAIWGWCTASRKGFDSALYFFGIGALNCLATRGFPTIGNELFPGMRNENSQLEKFIAEGGKVYACRLGLSLHGAREEDLMEGVIPCHPLDMQDAMIEYSRKGAIINTTWMF